MNILGLGHSNSGCSYHRVFLPVAKMPKTYGKITNEITEQTFEEHKYDIVYVNRMWGQADLIELRKIYGFKLVIDMDDYWVLDHFHLNYEDYRVHNFASKIIKHIREADLVTCTHTHLADRVAEYNKNVIIAPNAIPYGEFQFNDYRTPDERVRLFWAGGITHEEDLRILNRPLRVVQQTHLRDKVKMVFGGFHDSNPVEKKIWHSIADSFTAGGLLNHEGLRGMPVFEYYSMFANADMMLIPLRKTDFNAYKSNLKILEAAGKGIPVIASAVHPYLGFPEDLVNYAHNEQMWIHWLHKLIDNPDLRTEQGALLAEYCKKNYNFDEINQRRIDAFNSLINN